MILFSEFKKYAPEKSELKMIQYHKTLYYNIPCAFDIETSSYILNENKHATMYIWQMCVFGICVYGRTYGDLLQLFSTLKNIYCENGEKIIAYVHNLSYDSHFILKWLNITSIFATDIHEPLYFEHDNFLIFKCSLRLSRKKLANLANKDIKIDSKIKDFDYSLLRHSKTKLTDEELKYCETDIKIVYQYILSEIDINKDIYNIPYTRTGYPRRFCRDTCNDSKYHSWFMNNTPKDETLYKYLKQAFTGGITHANAIHCGVTMGKDTIHGIITNYDLQSDYPAQIVKNTFPVTPFIHDIISEFPKDDNIAVIAVVRFKNLRSKYNHSTLSFSKCYAECPYTGKRIISCWHSCEKGKCKFDNVDKCKNAVILDNGRIIKCSNITTVCTEIDFYNINTMYDYDSYDIIDSYTALKNYLPREFIMATLKLYSEKTKLKGVPNKKIEYQIWKEMLNALFGMCVTDIVHSNFIYYPENSKNGNMWEEETPADICESLLKYAENKKSFLLYQTGVYITAYARKDLIDTIANICDMADDTINGKPFDDIVYYDTDSLKVLHGEKYKIIFDSFNQANIEAMKKVCKYHHFKYDLIAPKDKKGNERILGIFDIEEPYLYFKTLGAKRYIYKLEKEEKEKRYKYNISNRYRYFNMIGNIIYKYSIYLDSTFHITIAGVNKDTGARYMCKLAYEKGLSPFDIFDDDLYFPAGKCGKKTLLYSDTGFKEIVTDYQGNDYIVEEKSYIYMCDSDYTLSISGDFMQLITKNMDGGY